MLSIGGERAGPDALPDTQPTASKHWRQVYTYKHISFMPSLSEPHWLGTMSVWSVKNENNTHTHTHTRFTALWILSGKTRVSWYQKKHSPTHTYRGHQSSLICFIHLHPSFHCLTVFFHNLSPSFLWSTSWPGTLHFILHTFLLPLIVIFSQCQTTQPTVPKHRRKIGPKD